MTRKTAMLATVAVAVAWVTVVGAGLVAVWINGNIDASTKWANTAAVLAMGFLAAWGITVGLAALWTGALRRERRWAALDQATRDHLDSIGSRF